MRTALDKPAGELDQEEQDFVAKIREYGWHSTSVFADDEGPGFTYSTGFWLSRGVPEVILFALKPDTAHQVLWDVYRDAEKGRQLPTGVRLGDILGNSDCFLFPVGKQHHREHLGWSSWFYGGNEFPCVQLVWPDKAGRFPWEAGFEEGFRRLQPDLSAEGWIKALRQ